MPKRDSVDKIVTSYFAAVNAEPFTYKGAVFPVKDLTASPLLLRGFTCPAVCGGCCPTFTLDYLPAEEHPYELASRWVEFNGASVPIRSDTQEQRTEHHCANLNQRNGRCGIHGRQPFSCDFELIRFLHSTDSAWTGVRLFGRGHQMLRVDGDRGALCTITPVTPESIADAVRKLGRLKQWCEYFGLAHRVDPIIRWAQGPANHLPLVLKAHPRQGFF